MFDYTNEEFFDRYRFIKERLIKNKHSSVSPIAYILGGQPGAGKSSLQREILKNNKNCIIINADAFRESHPHYLSIQNTYGNEAQNYTQPFINQVTENLIAELSDQKYNLIIEGTLRTAEVPLNTCKQLKKKGYRVELHIMAVKKVISYESTILRYENAIAQGKIPRATSKAHHDAVADVICSNLDLIYNKSIFDDIKLFNRNGDCLYTTAFSCLPSEIEKEILIGHWSNEEKEMLQSIITEILNLKHKRKAKDFSEYAAETEKLLFELGSEYFYIKVTPSEVSKLQKSSIPFEGKIDSTSKSIIKVSIFDKDKALSIIKGTDQNNQLHK